MFTFNPFVQKSCNNKPYINLSNDTLVQCRMNSKFLTKKVLKISEWNFQQVHLYSTEVLHSRFLVTAYTVKFSNFSQNVYIMLRLDQGHHHPKLEVSGLTCPVQESNQGLRGGRWAHEPSNSLFIAIRNIYIRACSHGESSRNGPPVHVLHELTWSAIGCRPNSTCKASARHKPAAKTSGTCKSTYSKWSMIDHVRVTTLERLDHSHLHLKLEVPGLTCPGWKSKSEVGGKHSRKEPLKQLLNSYSDIYRCACNHGECPRQYIWFLVH
jgi:hypothetical protein